MSSVTADIELENVGVGDSPFSLAAAASEPETNAVVLLLQRDYHCPKCRQQVQDLATRYDEFRAANTRVVAVLPDSAEKASTWQASYDLPYPLLADPSTRMGERFDQPMRFGALGKLHDMVGRMPEAIIFDTSDGTLELATSYEGSSPSDRPSIDDLLDMAREAQE